MNGLASRRRARTPTYVGSFPRRRRKDFRDCVALKSPSGAKTDWQSVLSAFRFQSRSGVILPKSKPFLHASHHQ